MRTYTAPAHPEAFKERERAFAHEDSSDAMHCTVVLSGLVSHEADFYDVCWMRNGALAGGFYVVQVRRRGAGGASDAARSQLKKTHRLDWT